jgi:glycine/D-amino acid oxidase-like deaminating enzyme
VDNRGKDNPTSPDPDSPAIVMSNLASIPHFSVIGAGLAGTALAWQLHWHGARILIIDRGDPVTASKIAAGLITPITGKRLAVDERFDEYYSAACEFYRRVEAETGTKFFHQPGSIRILRDCEECERFERKRDGELGGRIATATLDGAPFHSPRGCFAIPEASRLDVPTYLDASRRFFESRDSFRLASCEEFDVATQNTIFCTGIAALREKELPAEWFQPAKGEILTLQIPGLREDRIINRGVWLMRLEGDLYRAGATYSWDVLDDVPTAAGREELERRVKEFLKLPFEVVAHDAATRPITPDRQPILKQLSPRVWAFNGLGSKGALLAPHFAERLAKLLARQ